MSILQNERPKEIAEHERPKEIPEQVSYLFANTEALGDLISELRLILSPILNDGKVKEKSNVAPALESSYSKLGEELRELNLRVTGMQNMVIEILSQTEL